MRVVYVGHWLQVVLVGNSEKSLRVYSVGFRIQGSGFDVRV
jgi:hypothetical protein